MKFLLQMRKVAIFTIGVLIIAILGFLNYLLWPKSQKPNLANQGIAVPKSSMETEAKNELEPVFIPEIENKLFIATVDNYLNISIFDLEKEQATLSKKIDLDDSIGFGKWNFLNANESVQYNPKTKDIFFSTQGISDYGGDCINKDGTCTSRLYKMNIEQGEPTKLLEMEEIPRNWIINPFDDSIFISFVKENTQTIQKLRAKDGTLIFERQRQLREQEGLTEFVLSKDGSSIYQTSTDATDGSWRHHVLRLIKIDNLNGDIEEQKIFSGPSLDDGASISPDNAWLAFYSNPPDIDGHLYLYKISTNALVEIPYQGSINTSRLHWSGDSTRLFYALKEGSAFYDIRTSKSAQISNDTEQTPLVYAWGSSTDHVVSLSETSEITIENIQTHNVINTGLNLNHATIVGISWY